ncbi:hypothetical protein SEVIR_6G114930v4 [Setaria viridis]
MNLILFSFFICHVALIKLIINFIVADEIELTGLNGRDVIGSISAGGACSFCCAGGVWSCSCVSGLMGGTEEVAPSTSMVAELSDVKQDGKLPLPAAFLPLQLPSLLSM